MNRDDDQSDVALTAGSFVESGDDSAQSNIVRNQRLILRTKCNERLRLMPIAIPAALASHVQVLERVIQLNSLVLAHRAGYPKKRAPISIEDVIGADGNIRCDFEFLRFGVWLLIDGKPGLAVSPGLAANEETMLKTVAAATAMIWQNEIRAKIGPKLRLKKACEGPGWITATKMRDRWHIMYDQKLDQAVFRSRLSSAHRYLRAYLAHLKHPPSDASSSETKIRRAKSPHLAKVLAAMTPAAKP